VRDCYLIFQPYHGENKLISMRWWQWCPICIRSTCRVGFL